MNSEENNKLTVDEILTLIGQDLEIELGLNNYNNENEI